MNINTFTNAELPEFLTEEKAKEIRDEINGIVDKLQGKKTSDDVSQFSLVDDNRYIKMWALETSLHKWNITEDQLKKVIYAA